VTAVEVSAADRHARSRLVPGWDPDRLAAATAVVVGAGALGNEVAKNLALAGVGRLVLCDPDTVSASNLSRSVLFADADLDEPKPRAAAAALQRLAPGVEVVARERDLVSGVGLGELADAGVVVGCLDSVHARMQLLGRCALAGAALVDGGTGPWTGEVRLRLDSAEPCLGCTLGAGDRGRSDQPWSCADVDTAPVPASIVTTALIGAWATLAAVRILVGAPPVFRTVTVDGLGGRAEPVGTTRDPSCPNHHPLAAASPIDVTDVDTVATLLAHLPDDADPRAWTRIPVAARCAACGSTADLRGAATATCPRCGGIVRTRYSERLRAADPQARLTDLGIAPEEILTVRMPGGGHTCRRLACRTNAARM
jgi:molybdopterin/thiamine biosynthesis adenylyltransferase